jgi:hypothetical protein
VSVQSIDKQLSIQVNFLSASLLFPKPNLGRDVIIVGSHILFRYSPDSSILPLGLRQALSHDSEFQVYFFIKQT